MILSLIVAVAVVVLVGNICFSRIMSRSSSRWWLCG